MQLPPKPDVLIARRDSAYVRLIVARTGIKPTPLAKKIGVSPSTLVRLYNAEDDSYKTAHSLTLAKLEQFSGIPLPPVSPEEGVSLVPAPRERGPEVVPYDAAGGPLEGAIRALTADRKTVEVYRLDTQALEQQGFLQGDVILVDLDQVPRAGDPVCAVVRDGSRATPETIVRLIEPPYLVSTSPEAALRKPLPIDNDRVIVKGTILPYRLRAPR